MMVRVCCGCVAVGGRGVHVPRVAAALAWKHSNFKVLYTVDKGNDDWDGQTGHVTDSMIRSVLPPPVEDSLILVCGPPPMVKAIAGPKNKFEQGDLKGVLAHMGYTKSMVFKY